MSIFQAVSERFQKNFSKNKSEINESHHFVSQKIVQKIFQLYSRTFFKKFLEGKTFQLDIRSSGILKCSRILE